MNVTFGSTAVRRSRGKLGVLAVGSAILGFLLLPSAGLAGGPPQSPPLSDANGPSPEEVLAFRAEFGLSTDPAHVAPIESVDPRWGIPLTSEESADLANRVRIQESLGLLKTAVANLDPAIYGGMFLDQKAGGAIDIALTRPVDSATEAMLRLAMPSGAILRFRTVTYSLAELDATRATLAEFLGQGITVLWRDVRDNTVSVGVSGELSGALRSALSQAGDRIKITGSSGVQSSVCSNRASCTPYRAGLHIYRADSGFCTGGFMAKKGSGQYWLTAGHCGAIGTQWFHDEAGVGATNLRYYVNGGHADAAGITRPSGSKNWIFVTSGEPARPVTARQGQNADTIGESVCQSGYTTGFFCGVIYDDDFSGTDDNGITLHHMRVASIHVQSGDSGAPVFYGNTAKGLVEGFLPATCGQYLCGVYSHIWEVEYHMGVTVLTSS